MKVLLLFLFFIQDMKTFAESNCSSLEVDLHISSVEETSAQFNLTRPDSLDGSCIIKDINFTLMPDIYSGTCKISNKSCEFDNLKAFTNYTLTREFHGKIHPMFNEDQEGTPTSVTFFTSGACLPKNILSLEFEDDKLKWLLNSTFTPILNHFAITVKINQTSTCGGRTFTYLDGYVLHNESITLPKNVPGEWSICVELVRINQKGNCKNNNCISIYIPIDDHLAKVAEFSLTSGEKSLIAKWSPNPFWSHSCTLDYYQIYSHPSPKGHPASVNKTCINDTCQTVIKHLLPDTSYTIQITPIFSENVKGKMESRTEAPYNCPSAATDLNIERNLSHFMLSWADSNENKADFYEITLFTKAPCSTNYTSVLHSVNVSTYSFGFNPISPFLDAKIRVTSSKRHEYNCPSVLIEKEKMATQKIPLLVENLQLKDISETAAEISWTFPSTWETVCFPSPLYKVDSHSDPEAIKRFTDTSRSVRDLKPFTNYVFKIRACVNSKECQESKLNFTTMDVYPNIPEKVFSVDYKDLETFVDYTNGIHHNGNCSIRIADIQSNGNYLFNCTSGGKIQSKDLPSGREYKMEMEVCNTRGCKVSKPFRAYAAPTRSELPDVSVKASSSNSSIISLKFNSQKGDYNGSMYIVVSEVGDQHPVATEVEAYVRRRSNVSTKGRSAMERLSTRKHIIVEPVPLDTLNYDLQKEFLNKEGMETSNGIYVAPVMEYWAGGYKVVVAYDFCGPFKFGGIEQISVILWIAGSFGSVLGIVLLILMLQRKFSPLPNIAHNGTKKMSFSSPTYESSENNRDLDSECEKQRLNPDKVVKLEPVTKYTKTQREFGSDENVSIN